MSNPIDIPLGERPEEDIGLAAVRAAARGRRVRRAELSEADLSGLVVRLRATRPLKIHTAAGTIEVHGDDSVEPGTGRVHEEKRE